MFLSRSSRTITLLVLSPTEVMRVDVKTGDKPVILDFSKTERPARTPIAAAAELAISLNEIKPSQRTILLAEDLWSGIIDIDDRSIYGLEGDELNQMLKFETESQSYLDPMTGHLGFIELSPVPPDTRRFWCTSIASDVIMGIATAIKLRGGKLVFCAHPIGLANPEVLGVPWIEFSQTLAGAFAVGGDGFPRASIATRSKTSDRWFQALEVNFGSELPDEGWLMMTAKAPEKYQGALQSLEIEATLRRWIIATVKRLANPENLPVIAPRVPQTSERTFARIGAAATVVVALACGLHYSWGSRRKFVMEQELVELQKPAEQQRELNGEMELLNQRRAELDTQIERIEKQRFELGLLTANSDRFSKLLMMIAKGRDKSLVLDEITVHSDGLQLSGRAIRSDAAANLALHLSSGVGELGWKVEAPDMQGTNKLVNGGPWDFKIKLIETESARFFRKDHSSESVSREK